MICPGDFETLQHGARRNAISKVHDMIHDGGMRAAFRIGELRIRGGQGHVSDRFQPDAVMLLLKPDERLPLRVGPIHARVDLHHLAGGIQRGLIEGALDVLARKNVPAVRPRGRAKTRRRPLDSQGQKKPCAPRHHPKQACFMALSEARVLRRRPGDICFALPCLKPINLRPRF